jgi:hypothetical protein
MQARPEPLTGIFIAPAQFGPNEGCWTTDEKLPIALHKCPEAPCTD